MVGMEWNSASGVQNLKPAKCFLKYAHPTSRTNASSPRCAQSGFISASVPSGSEPPVMKVAC